jgi:hypothetical protein
MVLVWRAALKGTRSQRKFVKPMGRVAISPHGRTALPPTRFPARSRAPCRLLVQMPLEHGAYDYEVYVSQLHEGFEVGRVTWRIVPRTSPAPCSLTTLGPVR